MHLVVTTPLNMVIDADDVVSVVAEDASGSFGIMAGHANFLTTLTISVLSWSDADGQRHHCAVREGVLTVQGGKNVAVATREAITDDSLETLEDTVLAQFRRDLDAERAEHAEDTRLRLAAIRQIMRRLHGQRSGPLS